MKKKHKQGLTNRITIANDQIIKKSRRVSDYYLDRQNERKFYHQASPWDFIKVPSTIRRDWKGRWISKMTYFPQAQTLAEVNLTESKLRTVLTLINKLHRQSLELKIFNPRKLLRKFTKKVGVLPELKPLSLLVNQIIDDFFSDKAKLVVSHNDLIKDNFLIVDKQMYLIDFEYATLNHPLFDYASFISESLSWQQIPKFKKMLNLTSQENQKLEELEFYQDFLWAHWAEYLYQGTKEKIYQEIKKSKIHNAWKRAKRLNTSSIKNNH